jgi:hypothetical protein
MYYALTFLSSNMYSVHATTTNFELWHEKPAMISVFGSAFSVNY